VQQFWLKWRFNHYLKFNGQFVKKLSIVAVSPDSSLRYRRYINHLLTYLLKVQGYAGMTIMMI